MDIERDCDNNENLVCNYFDSVNDLCGLDVEEKLVDMPDVLKYVKDLQKLVAKQEKKIKKLQRKIKKKDTANVETQTDGDDTPRNLCITEEITEAAESAMAKTGFVYEETSGLYYDYNSGYYYNAEYGLYYDGNSGTYMSYDAEKQEYVFHSQVHEPKQDNLPEINKKRKNQGNLQEQKKKRKVDQSPSTDLEEGECSDVSEEKNSSCSDEENDKQPDMAQQWPPCMRIIVEETSIPTVKSGSLHLITYEGGTIGREGKHNILLPDINVSKHHLKFQFDKSADKYIVTDLGSRNGTVLNGKRMSSSKQESEPMQVPHGTRIQIGGTVLLCHVHPGSQTCGLCEPGLIQKKNFEVKGVQNSDNKQMLHKKELKKLKKKFAVGQIARNGPSLGAGYTDRAQVRRETVGSQNEHEKTQAASLDQSISTENKGFKLLSKMGWTQGQSLGKGGTGRVEPVVLVSNPGTAGMGSGESLIPAVTKSDQKSEIWTKTRERYDQLVDEMK